METKIAILLPTNRGLKPQTLQSLLELIAYKRLEYEIIVGTEGFTTAENRTWLTVQAIKRGATHLFFVDDDMIYEKDTLEKLLNADKDIVGAKYANRRGEGEVVEYFDLTNILKEKGEGAKAYLQANGFTEEKISEHLNENQIMEVKALGGGCVLIKAEVFKNVSQPWFWYKINEAGAITMSHDWYFCEKAREKGYQLWCDTSIKPGHIAKKAF